MERNGNTVAENPYREKIKKDWKDSIVEGATIVSEKVGKVIKPRTINCCWRKLCLHVVCGFGGLTTEPSKNIRKVTAIMAINK